MPEPDSRTRRGLPTSLEEELKAGSSLDDEGSSKELEELEELGAEFAAEDEDFTEELEAAALLEDNTDALEDALLELDSCGHGGMTVLVTSAAGAVRLAP